MSATSSILSSSSLKNDFQPLLNEDTIESVRVEVLEKGQLERFTLLLNSFLDDKIDRNGENFSNLCFSCADILAAHLQDKTTDAKIDSALVEKIVAQFLKFQIFLTAEKSADGLIRCKDNASVTFNSSSLYLTSSFFKKNSEQSEIDLKMYSSSVVKIFQRFLYGADIQRDTTSLSLPILGELYHLAVKQEEEKLVEVCSQILQSKMKTIKTEDDFNEHITAFTNIDDPDQIEKAREPQYQALVRLLTVQKRKYRVVAEKRGILLNVSEFDLLDKVTPFATLLNQYISGFIIDSIEQYKMLTTAKISNTIKDSCTSIESKMKLLTSQIKKINEIFPKANIEVVNSGKKRHLEKNTVQSPKKSKLEKPEQKETKKK